MFIPGSLAESLIHPLPSSEKCGIWYSSCSSHVWVVSGHASILHIQNTCIELSVQVHVNSRVYREPCILFRMNPNDQINTNTYTHTSFGIKRQNPNGILFGIAVVVYSFCQSERLFNQNSQAVSGLCNLY